MYVKQQCHDKAALVPPQRYLTGLIGWGFISNEKRAVTFPTFFRALLPNGREMQSRGYGFRGDRPCRNRILIRGRQGVAMLAMAPIKLG